MICVQSISQKQDKSYIIYISKITQLRKIQTKIKRYPTVRLNVNSVHLLYMPAVVKLHWYRIKTIIRT